MPANADNRADQPSPRRFASDELDTCPVRQRRSHCLYSRSSPAAWDRANGRSDQPNAVFCALVGSQTQIDGLSQLALAGPFREFHFGSTVSEEVAKLGNRSLLTAITRRAARLHRDRADPTSRLRKSAAVRI